MSRIFWDSNLFIYFLEGAGPQAEQVLNLIKTMRSRGDQLVTSALTLGEVLVKPMEKGDKVLTAKYHQFITTAAIVLDFNVSAARIYAAIRRDRTVRPPDAIQLACAGAAGVDLFITNDSRLHTVRVEGIQFIIPLARSPL